MKSYVYILLLKNKNLLKIGRTNSLSKRVSSLSLFYTFDKNKSFTLECLNTQESISLESTLHHTFHHKRTPLGSPGGTEFFDSSIYEDVYDMVKIISKNKNTKLFHIKQKFNDDTDSDKTIRYLSGVCNSIKNKRLMLDISQCQLAQMAGISKRTLERIENCNGSSSSFLTIIKLLKVLNINISIDQISDSDTYIQRSSRCKSSFITD